jgi:hypothetical protein
MHVVAPGGELQPGVAVAGRRDVDRTAEGGAGPRSDRRADATARQRKPLSRPARQPRDDDVAARVHGHLRRARRLTGLAGELRGAEPAVPARDGDLDAVGAPVGLRPRDHEAVGRGGGIGLTRRPLRIRERRDRAELAADRPLPGHEVERTTACPSHDGASAVAQRLAPCEAGGVGQRSRGRERLTGTGAFLGAEAELRCLPGHGRRAFGAHKRSRIERTAGRALERLRRAERAGPGRLGGHQSGVARSALLRPGQQRASARGERGGQRPGAPACAGHGLGALEPALRARSGGQDILIAPADVPGHECATVRRHRDGRFAQGGRGSECLRPTPGFGERRRRERREADRDDQRSTPYASHREEITRRVAGAEGGQSKSNRSSSIDRRFFFLRYRSSSWPRSS